MNQVLSLVRAVRASSDPDSRLYTDHMLAELLSLHEEMIAQLCVERLEAATNVGFLSGMIDQHEATAAQIRAHLEGRKMSTIPPIPGSEISPPENRVLSFPSSQAEPSTG